MVRANKWELSFLPKVTGYCPLNCATLVDDVGYIVSYENSVENLHVRLIRKNKGNGWGGLTLTDSYLQKKKQREAYEDQKSEIIFGLLAGTVLFLFGLLYPFPVDPLLKFTVYNVISIGLINIGLCMILLGIIVPAFLELPYKGFVFLGKKIGEAILLIFLAVTYFIIVLPVGLIIRKRRSSLGFFTWSGDYPYEEKSFEKIGAGGGMDIDSTKNFPLLENIYKLFGTLIRHKRSFLIPIVIILLLLGLILFFAASNIVFNFFIYTLF